MNWDAIGAIGEIAGAVAVVVSLIYLATQIRHSTRESQAASRDSISKAISDVLMRVAANPETSELYGRGIMNPAALSDDETRRFDMLMYATFECFESAYSQWTRNVLHDEDWHKWKSTIGNFMSQPGCQSFWARASRNFNPSFIEYVEAAETNENYSWRLPEAEYRNEKSVS